MSVLLVEDRGPVRLLTLNRPDRHNALDTELTAALLDGLVDAGAQPGVRAVVVAGSGRSFCSGADTGEFADLTPDRADAVAARAELTTRLQGASAALSVPVVAAAHGYVLGGGAGLAIGADLLVIADDARFGYPELRHGIVAAIVMADLVRQAGRKAAFELVATAEPISGVEVGALGLANRVVPAAEVLATAVGLAEQLAAWDPAAMAATKRHLHAVADLTLADGLAAGQALNQRMRGFRSGAEQ